MPDLWRFRTLSTREQAIVAIAVLLDGHDSASYLASDKERHSALEKASNDLAELSPDLRMPLAATLLRRAVAELRATVASGEEE
ncbi:MAG: hypothetical protein KDD44_00410 [Bdellovibrionales bacterium]|nr:hypothetical protein [Bdellovibrionales bacterium]